MLYPLKMKPCFRANEQTPWGGSSLRDFFGKDIPSDTTGESLEVSALLGLESIVINGECAGKRLREMIMLWGAALTGLPGAEPFPLLLKILDARETLSVQVHPDDAYALDRHGKLGKSEAWVVLSAQPGAKIVYGIAADGGFAENARLGSLEDSLCWREVYPGDVYYIPSGLVHALGAGIVVYEIQQSSDVTYRIWDFGRTNVDGKPRALHLEDAVNVIKPQLRPDKVTGATYLVEGGSVTAYVSDPHFELVRINLAGRMPISDGRMRMLTPMGACKIVYPGGEEEILPGETVLMPASLDGAYLIGRASVLSSAPPCAKALRDRLTYRASDVAGLI